MSKPQIVTFIVDKSCKIKSLNELDYVQHCKLDKITEDNIIFHRNIYSIKAESD